MRTWHPDGPNGQVEKKSDIMPHHEVLLRLDAMDLERGLVVHDPEAADLAECSYAGAKIAGHRGYFLTEDGVDLNQALISYGLDFLRKKGYKKVMPPFFMNKDQMAKTAQLDQFDEELYKVASVYHLHCFPCPDNTVQVTASEDDKYLIATSEQPISAFHSEEWFETPEKQLPIRYAGYSTCFRKEAGSAGRDM